MNERSIWSYLLLWNSSCVNDWIVNESERLKRNWKKKNVATFKEIHGSTLTTVTFSFLVNLDSFKTMNLYEKFNSYKDFLPRKFSNTVQQHRKLEASHSHTVEEACSKAVILKERFIVWVVLLHLVTPRCDYEWCVWPDSLETCLFPVGLCKNVLIDVRLDRMKNRKRQSKGCLKPVPADCNHNDSTTKVNLIYICQLCCN